MLENNQPQVESVHFNQNHLGNGSIPHCLFVSRKPHPSTAILSQHKEVMHSRLGALTSSVSFSWIHQQHYLQTKSLHGERVAANKDSCNSITKAKAPVSTVSSIALASMIGSRKLWRSKFTTSRHRKSWKVLCLHLISSHLRSHNQKASIKKCCKGKWYKYGCGWRKSQCGHDRQV